jgi:hypothetical protein
VKEEETSDDEGGGGQRGRWTARRRGRGRTNDGITSIPRPTHRPPFLRVINERWLRMMIMMGEEEEEEEEEDNTKTFLHPQITSPLPFVAKPSTSHLGRCATSLQLLPEGNDGRNGERMKQKRGGIDEDDEPRLGE